VIRALLLTFVLGLPLYLALSTASCGPTCGNLKGCSTTGASGDAGASSTSTTTTTTTSSTCAALTARQSCLSSYCQTADSPFCSCNKQGQELNVACKCVTPTTADAAAYCESAAAQGIDDSNFDCSAQTGALATLCVGVQ
jgi:hypothetical protein